MYMDPRQPQHIDALNLWGEDFKKSMLTEGGTRIEALRKRMRNRKPYIDPDTIRVAEL